MNNRINEYTSLIKFYIDNTYPEHHMDIKNIVQGAFEKCR